MHTRAGNTKELQREQTVMLRKGWADVPKLRYGEPLQCMRILSTIHRNGLEVHGTRNCSTSMFDWRPQCFVVLTVLPSCLRRLWADILTFCDLSVLISCFMSNDSPDAKQLALRFPSFLLGAADVHWAVSHLM
jgi:hypothetical protein